VTDERAKLDYDEITEIAKRWRQGDCTLQACNFYYQVNPEFPITASDIDPEDPLVADEVKGLCILTQTCDIVRNCLERHFLEVAPLVEVEEQVLNEIQKGLRPAYACVPGVASQNLVADLDRTMTVEKSCLKMWNRVEGCKSDAEIRSFAAALARKRVRFAFPDDFNRLASKLQGRIKKKHEKDTGEGKTLRNLREIRVRAAPSWESPGTVDVMFYFIKDNESSEGDADVVEQWLKLLSENKRYKPINGIMCTLDDITAKEYVESDRLDLDHLSAD